MSPLEERYRRLLTWLPEPARSRWADDMTDTWLEATTADDPEYAEFGSPSAADRLDVARLALRLRLGAPGASVRAVATGRTVRLVALAGTAALASMALVGLVSTAWLYGVLPVADAPDVGGVVHWDPGGALSTLVGVLTVALAACTARGLPATRALALAVLVGQAAEAVLLVGGARSLLTQLTLAVPVVAAALVPTGRPLGRPWWPVVLGSVVLGPWAVGLSARVLPDEPTGWLLALFDPFVQFGVGTVVAGAVLLARRPSARGSAELAVAVLSAALLPALAGRLPFGTPTGYAATVLTVTVAVAATAAVTGAVGLRSVRALPLDPAAVSRHPD
ncbi:hypothetical protein [Modestobacter sp. SSW1-42]|uniref:hypothetical protein n=1 Tax=Modestobacter sp. SSW1-42 TaxID=596372 RepID=UPI00398717F4